MSERISSFKDLRVYKLAFELQQQIFEISKRFPVEERYALTDQVRQHQDRSAPILLKLGKSGAM